MNPSSVRIIEIGTLKTRNIMTFNPTEHWDPIRINVIEDWREDGFNGESPIRLFIGFDRDVIFEIGELTPENTAGFTDTERERNRELIRTALGLYKSF
mgnify:CR=1 FL=1